MQQPPQTRRHRPDRIYLSPTPGQLATIDAARGDEARSAFALRVLMERAERGGKGGGS